MAIEDHAEKIGQTDVSLIEAPLGYDIRVNEETVGTMEGVPGEIEYLVVKPPWEGKGVARAALNEFISLSEDHGFSKVTTNNATHPAMEHILETEDFRQREDEIGWEKKVV